MKIGASKEDLKLAIREEITWLRQKKHISNAESGAICLQATGGTPSKDCSIQQLAEALSRLRSERQKIQFINF